MDSALLVILLITGNLVLYWLFFGRRRFEQKLQTKKSQHSKHQLLKYKSK